MDDETRFVLSTFSFLIWGGRVMWMCAGFTMLEAGSVRTKNASVICLKNIGLYSIACLTFYLVGYNIMFTGVEAGGWFGSLDLLHGPTIDERALLGGAADAMGRVRLGDRKRGHVHCACRATRRSMAHAFLLPSAPMRVRMAGGAGLTAATDGVTP